MRPLQKVLLVVVVVVVLVSAGVAGAVLGKRHADSGDHDDAASGDDTAPSSSAPPSTSPSPSAPSSASAPSVSDPAATTPPDPALAPFYSQRLSWAPCPGRAEFQCATLDVPLDYDHPTTTIKLALLKDPADDQSAKVGSLVVNPGGPGGSGTDYAAAGGFAFGRALREHFDIVGFDPRGVGKSDPVDCLGDDQLDQSLAADPTPDTPAEIRTYLDWARKMGTGCAERSPDIAAHDSTVEAARDMDVLRAALGEKQLDYLGASYGTKLGTTYADLFPTKVGRFVLDGAMDPHVTTEQLNLQQGMGFEVALRSYVKHCVDSGNCYLGDTVDAGVRRVQTFLADVDRKPLPTSDGRTVTEGDALFGILMPLYSRDYWSMLDQALQDGLNGKGDQLQFLADQYSSRNPGGGFKDNSVEANWAINCLDDPTSFTPAQIEKALPAFKKASPTFGTALAWMMAGCTGEKLHAEDPAPPVGAPGANPIVVVGTTRDPATPYQWAQHLAKDLDSGVLVSRDGDGHTGYNSGNTCVDDAVEGYLVQGKVPKDGLSC